MTTMFSGHISHARLLHFGVWSAQVLLASTFAAMATLKLLLHYDRLVEIFAWAGSVPPTMVRLLGAVELLGAIAVAAPAVTPKPQRVVGWAAVGFLSLMVSAAIFHLMRGEFRMLPVNLAIGALAAFVAWGRLAHKPLEVDEAL